MGKIKSYFGLAVILLVILSGLFLISGDTYNVAPTTTNESYSELLFVFYPSMAADSTGSFHSQPLFIGDLNDNDARIVALGNATTDLNVIFHYSLDRTTWQSVTATGLDACSNTAKYDTLGNGEQIVFHSYQWLIVENDGQAGANTTDKVKVSIQFRKDGTYIDQYGKWPKNQVWRVEPTSVTNP